MAATVRGGHGPVLKGGPRFPSPEREPMTCTWFFRSLLPPRSLWLAGNGTSVVPQKEDVYPEGAASG